jgi:hypothetical protein
VYGAVGDFPAYGGLAALLAAYLRKKLRRA